MWAENSADIFPMIAKEPSLCDNRGNKITNETQSLWLIVVNVESMSPMVFLNAPIVEPS